jgi:hypothetical protein
MNRVEERIIRKTLEAPENEDEEDKPLTLYSESLKGYFKDLKKLQEDDKKKVMIDTK